METRNHIAELIKRWPRRQDFAEEVGATLDSVHKWAQSGRVPSDRQMAVRDAAARRGFFDITSDWMLAVHADALPTVQTQEAQA